VEGPAVHSTSSQLKESHIVVHREQLTYPRQVERAMNKVCEVVITTITPNGSAALPFVIPSEAEGSAVLLMDRECKRHK